MGRMASSIEQQMREDGIDPSQTIVPGDTDTGQFGDSQPGDEPGGTSFSGNDEGDLGVTPPAPASSAGTKNTDTGQLDGSDPGPVPYTRFKEVNDRFQELRDYGQLQEYGYTPDHLVRLAQFEAGYLRDPVGTVKALVDDLDLPSEAKSRITESLGIETKASGDGGDDDGDGSTSTGLSPEDRELLNWARQRRAQETQDRETAERNRQLDQVVNAWKASDEADKLDSPPEKRMLAFISASAASGNFRSLEELAEAARNEWLEERDRLLGSAVQGGRRRGTPPPALPENGVLPAPAVRPKTLRDASKLAQAAMERGELPTLGGN